MLTPEQRASLQGTCIGDDLDAKDKLIAELSERVASLQKERDTLSMEPRVSDTEMNALLRRVNKEFLDRADTSEDVLRSLACSLSVGGYNAETVDAAVFEAKIRDGIDMLTKPLTDTIEQLRSDLLKASERVAAQSELLNRKAEASPLFDRVVEALRPFAAIEWNREWTLNAEQHLADHRKTFAFVGEVAIKSGGVAITVGDVWEAKHVLAEWDAAKGATT